VGTKVVGQQLFTSFIGPFLGISYTTDFFKQEGKVPFSVDAFMISSRYSIIYEAQFFKTEGSISSIPGNYLFFMLLNIFIKSASLASGR
jgi:hypothetical protein